MQIVIEIDEKLYRRIYNNSLVVSHTDYKNLFHAVRNGTVLPEHGDLVDIRVLEKTFEEFWKESRKNGISMCYADIGTILGCYVPCILKHNP